MRASHSYLVAVTMGLAIALAGYVSAQQAPQRQPAQQPQARQPQAQQPTQPQSQQQAQKPEKTVKAETAYRTETLKGMTVKNPEGEELGKIHDFVIDMRENKIRYVALSFGGFLGIGDKLFAIPAEALQLKHDGEDSYFVLDIPKETLKSAPGFAQDSWPDFADPTWIAGMEKHYGRYQTMEGTVESTEGGRLVLTDRSGQRQTLNIGPNVQIVADGESADLDDLKAGQHVKVTMSERDGKQVVTSVRSTTERTARQPQREEPTPRRQ